MSDEKPNDDPLLRALRRLPEAIEPRQDLWAGIAAGIEETRTQPRRPAPRKRWNVGLGLAAGMAGIAIGGLGAYLLLHEQMRTSTLTSAELGSTPPPQMIPAAFGQNYFKERNALLSRLTTQLQTLSPADQAKVRAALREIDTGLTALNDALAHSPDSILLQQLVLSAYQQQLQTLQDIADATAATNGDAHT